LGGRAALKVHMRKSQVSHSKGETEIEKSEAQEAKTFVVDINLTQRLVALLTAVFLGYLAWGQEEAVASNPQTPLAASTGLRQYYITTSHHNGADADTIHIKLRSTRACQGRPAIKSPDYKASAR
jgi:hypothetical protein